MCVFLAGQAAPMIVQKQDGAFLYATTDLATIQYRMDTWRPDAILYVVDHRQSLHFDQLFATVRLWATGTWSYQHVSFRQLCWARTAAVQDPLRTAIGLSGLLDEAVERGLRDRLPERTTRDPSHCSRRLSAARWPSGSASAQSSTPTWRTNRTSDYVFSYDQDVGP